MRLYSLLSKLAFLGSHAAVLRAVVLMLEFFVGRTWNDDDHDSVCCRTWSLNNQTSV
jgi:hypothetical protein